MDKLLLTIELVPKSSWYNNVRSKISPNEWNIIRRVCYKIASHKCEICNSKGKIECHEIWDYNDILHIQKLIGFICLCKDCHRVKHPGLAKIKGEEHLVEIQLMKINKMTYDKAIDYINESFKIWHNRNKYEWPVDISYVDSYINVNVEPNEPLIF